MLKLYVSLDSVLYCMLCYVFYNVVLMHWLVLGTKTMLLGVRKGHVLVLTGSVTKNKATHCSDISSKTSCFQGSPQGFGVACQWDQVASTAGSSRPAERNFGC